MSGQIRRYAAIGFTVGIFGVGVALYHTAIAPQIDKATARSAENQNNPGRTLSSLEQQARKQSASIRHLVEQLRGEGFSQKIGRAYDGATKTHEIGFPRPAEDKPPPHQR